MLTLEELNKIAINVRSHKILKEILKENPILDYIDNAGIEIEDLNLKGEIAISNPIMLLWQAVNHGTGGAKPAFFEDMLHLCRQLQGKSKRRLPEREEVEITLKMTLN